MGQPKTLLSTLTATLCDPVRKGSFPPPTRSGVAGRHAFRMLPLAIQGQQRHVSSANTVQLDAHSKALSLNLPSIYGTLAEIGAGQEVARWFLAVGGASGTVAKTISAYDKTVSDDIYGTGTRYVSKERLLDMLDHEYKLLLDRLNSARGEDTRFFVFADTLIADIDSPRRASSASFRRTC